MKTETQLNDDLYKDRSKFLEKKMRLMIKSFIKKCPTPILIQILKEEKIIQRDWVKDGEKYEERRM